MAIKSYFFNAVLVDGAYDRIYNADDFTSYLDKLVGNGVFPNPSTQLQVRASSGMDIVVGAGSGWINGHKMENTADMIMTIDASDVILNRIDRVIMFVDYNLRTMGIEIKKGTAAAEPVAPSLQRDTSRFEMALADVRVNRQVTAITTSMITDTRGNSSLCGFVQGLVQQVDTTTLFEQWQAAFDEWFEEAKQEFQSGKSFRKLEAVYTTTTSEQRFNIKELVAQYSYTYDIVELYANGLHLNGNEYTIRNNILTLTNPVAAGTVLDFVVYHFTETE